MLDQEAGRLNKDGYERDKAYKVCHLILEAIQAEKTIEVCWLGPGSSGHQQMGLEHAEC